MCEMASAIMNGTSEAFQGSDLILFSCPLSRLKSLALLKLKPFSVLLFKLTVGGDLHGGHSYLVSGLTVMKHLSILSGEGCLQIKTGDGFSSI